MKNALFCFTLSVCCTAIAFSRGARAPLPDSVDRCRFAPAAAKVSIAWDNLSEDHRFKEAIPLGFRVVDTNLHCARLEAKLSRRATYVAQSLLQAMFIGIDAFQIRDTTAMKMVALRYLPVALYYRRVPGIDRLTASSLDKSIA